MLAMTLLYTPIKGYVREHSHPLEGISDSEKGFTRFPPACYPEADLATTRTVKSDNMYT